MSNMPSKLRKAIGAVKDQTSISLAKVTNAANLEVIILKATTHDEIAIDERYVNEIVHLVSCNKVYAAACAQYVGRRIGKTKNWVVVLKSLMIILRIFQDGDPYFPREVFHAMKRGARILNLSGFRDDSSSSPWDYSAFVRTIALYLDERLDCFLTGKLQRRVTLRNQNPFRNQKNKKLFNETGIKEMKPAMLLDRITYWQRLLDRAMGTKPTASAKTNRLVLISLYAIVQETFELYRDISDGLVVILDNFFKLPCKACISAFQACVKSCKQFDELSSFYSFCVSIGVGRSSEYPKVQKISEELMEALQEFLRDQAANYSNDIMAQSSSQSPLSKHLLVSALRESVGSSQYKSEQDDGDDRYGTPERYYETASEYGSSQCTSLEDLMSATDAELSTPSRMLELDCDQDEKQSQYNDDISSVYESCSNYSYPIDQIARSSLELESPDDEMLQQEGNKQRNNDCWELVLVETATSTPKKTSNNDFSNGFDSSLINNLFDQPSLMPQNQYNPFLELEDIATVSPSTTTTIDQNQANLIDFFEATPMAPPTKSSSSQTDLDLIFGDFNSKTLSPTPPTFRAQDSQGSSLKISLPSSYQSQTASAPTFNSQRSFKINTTSSFSNHSSAYEKCTTPTFNSQGSLKFNSSRSVFEDHGSYQMSTATPTFRGHNAYQTSTPSTFHGYNSYQTSIEPTFRSHNSYQTSTNPTFHGYNSYQTSTTPTFRPENLNLSMAEATPSLASEGTFWGDTFYDTVAAAPTFRANQTMVGQTSKEDDLFGPWPSSLTSNEHGLNKSMQEQSLLQQQQKWLEQQKKIIEKHLN